MSEVYAPATCPYVHWLPSGSDIKCGQPWAKICPRCNLAFCAKHGPPDAHSCKRLPAHFERVPTKRRRVAPKRRVQKKAKKGKKKGKR